MRFDRQALARAGITDGGRQRTLETALGGRVATDMWENERPVPVRLILPLEGATSGENRRSHVPGDARRARSAAASSRRCRSPAARLDQPRGNSRFLALKFNVDGRDMGSVVNEAIATVDQQREAARRPLLRVGRRIREPAARGRPAAPGGADGRVAGVRVVYMAMDSGRSALAMLMTVPFALTGGAFALMSRGFRSRLARQSALSRCWARFR